jgi:glycine/D-amino acid oxidase-like deaminating enzyme
MILREAAAGFDRRRMIGGSLLSGMLGLGGCTTAGPRMSSAPSLRSPALYGTEGLKPVRASVDRLFDITVCLRPFRAAGPRLDVEQVAGKTIVHNYGHGGSGWSLSWGSGTIAVEKAMASSPAEIAVIGCGALGLTAAVLAQRAGAKVTIYAKDMLPQARSARATGSWTPDSRIALTSAAGPAFPAYWEAMARTSFKYFRNYLGLPGDPVEWTDRYIASDRPIDLANDHAAPETLDFASLSGRLADLQPAWQALPPGTTPFNATHVYRSESLQFNIADYGHTLLTDFFAAGGRFVGTEFAAPADIARIRETVVINCPGYGARALWRDESVVPVRGQIGWLIPQPECHYGVFYKQVSVLTRRDGIVVQALEGGDMKGYGNDHEVIDRDEATRAVTTVADLFSRWRVSAAS